MRNSRWMPGDFRFKARKAGDLKLPPGREIRSLALVVLAVLSLCLPSFTRGQGTAVGLTNSPAVGDALFYPNPSPTPSNR